MASHESAGTGDDTLATSQPSSIRRRPLLVPASEVATREIDDVLAPRQRSPRSVSLEASQRSLDDDIRRQEEYADELEHRRMMQIAREKADADLAIQSRLDAKAYAELMDARRIENEKSSAVVPKEDVSMKAEEDPFDNLVKDEIGSYVNAELMKQIKKQPRS